MENTNSRSTKKEFLKRFKHICNLKKIAFYNSTYINLYVTLKEVRTYIETKQLIPLQVLKTLPLSKDACGKLNSHTDEFLKIMYSDKIRRIVEKLIPTSKGYTYDDVLNISNVLFEYDYYKDIVWLAHLLYLNSSQYLSVTDYDDIKKFKNIKYKNVIKLIEKNIFDNSDDEDDILINIEDQVNHNIKYAQNNYQDEEVVNDIETRCLNDEENSQTALIEINKLINYSQESKSDDLYESISTLRECIDYMKKQINTFKTYYSPLERKYFLFSATDIPSNLNEYNKCISSIEIKDKYLSHDIDLEDTFYSELIKLMNYDLSLYDEIQDDSLNVGEHISETKNEPSIQSAEEMSDKVSEKEEDSTKVTNEEEFTLPDNLFKILDSPKYKGQWIEQPKNTDAKDLPSSIATLINMFAQYGYIDNDYITKASFAFRLTGRNKPDNFIEKIPWHDCDGGYKTLIYFLKNYSNTNGRYERFEGFLSLDRDFVTRKTQKKIELQQYSSYGETCPKDDIKKHIDEHFT